MGGFRFGGGGYFTWLCAVPHGTVTGSLFYKGKEHPVTGMGYHDHQWGNVKHNDTWDHWVWARQDFGNYALLVFYIGAQKKFGYERLPMMFLQDQEGDLLMQDLRTPECHFIEEYQEKLSGKIYPKKIQYRFRDGEKIADYTIELIEELETRDPTSQLAKPLQWFLKAKGLHPSTSRNYANGHLIYHDGRKTVEKSGHLI